jgi:hypothetical protein
MIIRNSVKTEKLNRRDNIPETRSCFAMTINRFNYKLLSFSFNQFDVLYWNDISTRGADIKLIYSSNYEALTLTLKKRQFIIQSKKFYYLPALFKC